MANLKLAVHWLHKHKFEAHLAAFLMMALPPAPLYMAAQRGLVGWMWAWLGLMAAANLLLLAVR